MSADATARFGCNEFRIKYVFATNVAGVCLNVILLCVCFRPAKFPPHWSAVHCDEVHHLDDLLVTVAVNGQQGSHTSEQQAAIINTRLGPNGMPVMIHRSAAKNGRLQESRLRSWLDVSPWPNPAMMMLLLFTTALIPHFLHDAESNTCLGTLAYLCVQGAAEPAAVAHDDLHGHRRGNALGNNIYQESTGLFFAYYAFIIE